MSEHLASYAVEHARAVAAGMREMREHTAAQQQTIDRLEGVVREQEAELLKSRMAIIQEALRADLCEFREVPEKEAFLKQFEGIRNRYDFLVLHGQSCTGETIWAKWLFDDPQAVLEINCASCPEPDLRDFRPLAHKGILFDEASAEMVLRQLCAKR